MTAPSLEPGQVIAGRYAVVSLLEARGPVARYRASASGREVWMTLLDPTIKFEALAEMEQRARAVSAFVPAEAVAPLLEAAVDQAIGAPFRAFEPPGAPSLVEMVARERVHPAHVAALLRGLARVLDPMHEHGVVHGALHPANVFVGPGPTVRVDDFDASVVLRALPTPEGYAHLAPWMAPEQVRDGAAVDGRADVFAAGLLAFFAATGRSYWRSCQADKPDLLALHREVVAPRTAASVRAAEIGVALATHLDAALGTALHVDPEQRFRTVSELAAALEQALGATPGSTPPPPMAAFGAPRPGEVPVPTVAFAAPPPPPVQAMPAPLVAPAFAQPAAPAARGKGGLIIALVAAFVLLAGGALGWFFVLRPRAPNPDAAAPSTTPTSEVAAASVAPTPAAVPTATSEPAPVASATAEPEPPAVPATASAASTTAAVVATTQSTARPPTISTGAGPAKPCGKFLKRCD